MYLHNTFNLLLHIVDIAALHKQHYRLHNGKINSMIFKTWLSDINKTALALESLNKIKFNINALSVADISRIADVKNITAVFNELQSISKADYGDFGALKIQESAVAVSTLSGELQASTLMMNGFSEAETRAVLSANGLTDAEIEQALAFAQSGESIKLYNAEVIKAGLQNSALSSTEQKLVLDKLGLIDATTGELISTKQVTQAKLEEALINSGLEASEASVTAERIISTVAQGTQKASIEAILALTKKQIVENAKYIASMVAAHPVATALGVALAALGGAIVYNTHKEKEYQKALKDSVDTMSSATSEYSNSASKLDELVEKYKSLEKQLSLTNLTEEETYQIKSDLYDVQCDLIDNFGNEAKGIDLVNGEYREQLGLLQQINKEAAEAYLTKNKEDYDNNISYLTDKEDFRSKYTSEWSSKNSGYMSNDLKNILEANGLTIDAETWRSELGGAFTKYFVEFENVTREEAYNLAMRLGEVLRSAGEENANLMEDPYYDLVQSYLSYVTTELIDESELNSAKENADYYEKLSATYSSSFGNLYNSFVDARDEYLEALQTGDNVDNARINFDNIYGEFQNSSKVKSDEIENAFADVKNSIDEELVNLNDWEKSLSGSNELDVISSLKVTDDQLRGINWDDEFTSPAEEAFGNLLTYLGASREDIEQVISLLVKMGAVMGEVDVKGDTFNDKYPIFSSFTDTDFGTRIQHITDMFNEGTISHKEYFDALQSEIDNFDASNFTDSMEDMTKASAQFFVDSMQQAADGLSGLINSFDNGEMSISEYLEGYLAIGNTLSTLTDNLQENSAAWNEHGEAISEVGNTALDDTQNKLNYAMSIIESYQDSIYSLEQIMNDAVTVGSDEFTAHANVIAEDLYYIIQTGGEMADTIANTLGTTTSEIAQSLTENVSNQEIACQAIMANTNNAITSMADSIGQLFDTLGNAISNFKVDLSFGVKTIDWKKVNVLGTELSLPEIKFELGASGESLDKIGSALSSFGKTIASNYTPQTIELEDFHFGSTDAAKDRKYSPSSGITNNYENALDRIKDATKSTSSSAKSEFEEMVDFFERRIDELEDALSLLKTSLDNVSGSFAKNNLIDAELGITEEKFNNYTDALAMYTQKANEALSKLPADIAAKVKDGAVALTDFIGDGNKDVVEAIKEYESWADKVSDCKQELEELKTTIRQLELEKFNNIMDDFSNQFDLRGDSKNLISKQIDLLKEAGELIGESFYTAQINQSKKQLELLENEKAQLVNQMSSAIGSGRVNCCPLLQ